MSANLETLPLGGERAEAGRNPGTALDLDWVAGVRVNRSAVAIWVLGLATFHLLPQVSTQLGSTLPTLAITFLLARFSR